MQQQFSLAYIMWILKDAREYNLDLTSLMDEITLVKERVKKMQLFITERDYTNYMNILTKMTNDGLE